MIPPAEAGGRAALPAPLLFTEPASDKLLTLGALPLLTDFPTGAGVEVEVSEGSASGSAAGMGLGPSLASSASACFAFAKSLSSWTLYLSAAADVYCTKEDCQACGYLQLKVKAYENCCMKTMIFKGSKVSWQRSKKQNKQRQAEAEQHKDYLIFLQDIGICCCCGPDLFSMYLLLYFICSKSIPTMLLEALPGSLIAA